MSEIAWDDSLSVGVDLIDDQHKLLIEKLKDLSDDFKQGHEQNKILRTLGFMIDYTDFHFTAEEKVMAENDYPGLEDQQQQHAEFKATLDSILLDLREDGPTEELVKSINIFLLNWLVNHIKGSDQKLGAYLNEQGQAK
ncbi:MAG: hemerythrin family protein [Candidatus Aminicenantaceae bacterium]